MTTHINITGKGKQAYAKRNLGSEAAQGIDIAEKTSKRETFTPEKTKQEAKKISDNYQKFQENKKTEHFSPAQQIAVSQIINEHQQEAPQGQGVSKRAVETLLSHVAKSIKKKKGRSKQKDSAADTEKHIREYLEKQTNLKRTMPMHQQKQSQQRQIASTKKKKKRSIAGKVAAWSAGILGTTYFMAS